MWRVPASQDVLQCFDQIACVHMFGLLVRSHTNAGQDGFRDESSIHNNDLVVLLRQKLNGDPANAVISGKNSQASVSRSRIITGFLQLVTQ
jgi:hypothetical protein